MNFYLIDLIDSALQTTNLILSPQGPPARELCCSICNVMMMMRMMMVVMIMVMVMTIMVMVMVMII